MKPMETNCTIEVVFPDAKSLNAAHVALSHEKDVSNRSKVTFIKKAKTIEIKISAKDIVALRASANACLRALQVFEGIENES